MSVRIPFILVIANLFAWSSSVSLYASSAASGAEKETAATQLAISVLARELGVTGLGEDDVTRVHVSRVDWPNSALGCPQPGQSYTQSIIPGYLVLLRYNSKLYRVHVGSGRGLICKLAGDLLQTTGRLLVYLKKLARDDLALRLGLDEKSQQKIQVVEEKPMVWPDAGLGCAAGSAEVRNVPGYVLMLKYRDRVFEYRTTRTSVAACPPIEAQ